MNIANRRSTQPDTSESEDEPVAPGGPGGGGGVGRHVPRVVVPGPEGNGGGHNHHSSGKDLFDRSHDPSPSSLYPDVLKIKTIIVEKQNFAKMPFDYYYKFISDNSAAWTSWQQGCQIMDF